LISICVASFSLKIVYNLSNTFAAFSLASGLNPSFSASLTPSSLEMPPSKSSGVVMMAEGSE
jgi:hypothetical protein